KALSHESDGNALKHAKHFRDAVVPAMTDLRETGDELEAVMPVELWPLATYREMLFVKESHLRAWTEGAADTCRAFFLSGRSAILRPSRRMDAPLQSSTLESGRERAPAAWAGVSVLTALSAAAALSIWLRQGVFLPVVDGDSVAYVLCGAPFSLFAID